MESTQHECRYVDMVGNAVNSCNIREPKHYDREKALEESRRILALLNSPMGHGDRRPAGSFSLSSCYFCKTLMPLTENSNCQLCNEAFCSRHKTEINHNCEKLSKDTAMYLNAKNQFKLRLREAKKALR
jgi:hypothetical protein